MRNLATLWLGLWAATLFAASPALVPLPRQMQLRAGIFTLCPTQVMRGAPAPAPTLILVDGAARETGEYLAQRLFRSTGFRFTVATNSGLAPVPHAILLTTKNALPNLGAEGYELTVAPDSVVIRAPATAGLFYGVQTLLQLLPPEILSPLPVTGVAWTAPCVYIQDWPRFPWRGYMLDSVRHFFNVDEVKKLIDGMALHKLNRFHWHLDDDSGWRLQITNYPALTQVSSWRTDMMWDLNPRSSTAWDKNTGLYGGYYTQDQAREIVQYAAQRHITVIPEIEMPGHSTSALAAYPQYACQCSTCYNGPYSLNVTSYVGGVFCIARPETTVFLQNILKEVMNVFPGPYVHIGGDEVSFSNWNRHTLDQQKTNALRTSSMQVYQSQFAQQMANWVKDQGRSLVGWSEIFNGGTVSNAVVMDWQNGTLSRAMQAVTNRQYVIMCPSATMYINKWENGSSSGNGAGVLWSNEPPAQSGYVGLANVYGFEPVPTGLAATYTNFILGAEGPTWAEWIPSLQNMEFRMYPRLSAIAELSWTPAELKDWTSFTNRLVVQKQRLARMGINYNPSATMPAIGTWTAPADPTTYSTLEWDVTSSITAPGEFDVCFSARGGTDGLDIEWAALLENGVEVDRDTHAGYTGRYPRKPLYVLRLPARHLGATYTLQASVVGHSGTNSSGIVFRTNFD